MDHQFDDDEYWMFDAVPDDGVDEVALSLDRYVNEGIGLIEDWLRHAS